jgi:hypothetical protein
MTGFENPETFGCVNDARAGKDDLDAFANGFEARRTWIVPNALLAVDRPDGGWRAHLLVPSTDDGFGWAI